MRFSQSLKNANDLKLKNRFFQFSPVILEKIENANFAEIVKNTASKITHSTLINNTGIFSRFQGIFLWLIYIGGQSFFSFQYLFASKKYI